MSKKGSTEKTEKKPEQTTEEPETELEKMQAIKDWKDYNGAIKFSPSLKLHYCFDCHELLESGKKAGIHAAEVHGLQIKYSPESTSEPSDETSTEGISRKGLSAMELRKLLIDGTGRAGALIDPADLALEINAEEEAKHIRELIKNPYVLYMFSKMKDERIIYPDWNIADALREGFLVLADKLGCYASFGQDVEKLKQDPHWSNVAIKIAEAWERQDAEEAEEKAKPKQTIAPEVPKS